MPPGKSCKRPANAKRTKIKPWEPSATMLEWHRLSVIECLGPTEISKRHPTKISKQAIAQAIDRVEEWCRTFRINEVINHRGRQIAQYQHMQQQMLEAFEKSKGKIVTSTETIGKDQEETVVTKTEISHGDVAYVHAFYKAMSGIEGLLGLKAPTESKVLMSRNSEEIPELLPMRDYKSRADALRAVSEAFAAKADAEAAKSIGTQAVRLLTDSNQKHGTHS